MTYNTAKTLDRGMAILEENMGIVAAETFVFLIKSEGFDYTSWQRNHFGNKSKTEMDKELDAYFAAHPYSGASDKMI